MKKLLFFLFIVLGSIETFSQNVTTIANVNLRESNNSSAKKLITIPKNTLIYIDGCTGGWCKTDYNDLSGYVSSKIIFNKSTSLAHNTLSSSHTPIKYYTNSSGRKIQSPTYYEATPAGATAVCRDGTYSFSTSRRGTCSHHGGVKKWL